MNDATHDPEIIDPHAANSNENRIAVASEVLPPYLTLLPLSNRPLFPGLVVPLVYEGEEIMHSIRQLAERHEHHVGLVLLRDEAKPFESANLYDVGVVAKVIKAVELEGHSLHLVVECLNRFRIESFVEQEGQPLRARTCLLGISAVHAGVALSRTRPAIASSYTGRLRDCADEGAAVTRAVRLGAKSRAECGRGQTAAGAPKPRLW